MSNENLSVKGNIEIQVIDAKTKEIIETKKFSNILVNNGIKMHRNWAANVLPIDDAIYNIDSRITHLSLGDDNSAVLISQTSLGNELISKELYPTPDAGCEITLEGNDTAVYTILIDETELNGEIIREMGLFSKNLSTFMVSRFLVGNLSKTSAVQFKIIYKYKYLNA